MAILLKSKEANIRAEAWFWADSWVITAGIWAFIIDGAKTGFLIQKSTVASTTAVERVNFVFEIEMLNNFCFHQTFGDVFGRFVSVELIDHAHAD